MRFQRWGQMRQIGYYAGRERRYRLLVWALTAGALLAGGIACGPETSAVGEGASSETVTTAMVTTIVSSTTTRGDAASTSSFTLPRDGVGKVFGDLVRDAAPMVVYGFTELPTGVSVAEWWWPVIDVQVPDDYKGPAVRNPRVSGRGEIGPEIQLVLHHTDGWSVVLENFRGDLGDVDGEVVGTVSGHKAMLHAVNGGFLVQWSDAGRWYGVFGRGLDPEEIVDLALMMQPMELPE